MTDTWREGGNRAAGDPSRTQQPPMTDPRAALADEIVDIVEQAIFETDTGLAAALLVADRLDERGVQLVTEAERYDPALLAAVMQKRGLSMYHVNGVIDDYRAALSDEVNPSASENPRGTE
jgi:hypothetical protein